MLKVLHTADWHIGQTFYEHDRTFEHEQFLLWLVNTITINEIDVLLISGDVFDGSNPSTTSVNLWYNFLANITHVNQHLQIIVTAGNHDSAARLEAPNPFFKYYNIQIIGTVKKLPDGSFDYDKLLIPIKNKEGIIKAWCLAVPYLRPGDYPILNTATSIYAEGIASFYKDAFDYALTKHQLGQAIIAMGHLHTLGTATCGNDKNERSIMGGIEFVPSSAFNDQLAYTALGHIHKAQMIGGKENIRYSGSPIPMSFSEINYQHQVVIFDLFEEKAINIKSIVVPKTIPLLRVPSVPKPLSDVLMELSILPEATADITDAPYLEVRIFLEAPEPFLRNKIEVALLKKKVRFTRIDVNYAVAEKTEKQLLSFDDLQKLQPVDIFFKIYQAQFKNTPPEDLIELFKDAALSVNTLDN